MAKEAPVQVVTLDEYDTRHLEQTAKLIEEANSQVKPDAEQEEIHLKELDLDPFVRTDQYTDQDREKVCAEMVKACEEIGFLVIKNHGVPQELVENMLTFVETFFRTFPLEEKQKSASDEPRRGYVFAENKQSEGLIIAPRPGEEKPSTQHYPKLEGFEECMNKYYAAMASLEKVLLKVIAKSLGIDEASMVNNIGSHKGLCQLNYYRKLSDKHRFEEREMGGHTDWGPLTILVQGTPGLHVLKDHKWHRVNTGRDKFVVNLGDAMNRWTNGRFASTIHCARLYDDVDRVSIPYFVAQAMDPSDTRPLVPLVKCGEDATFKEGSFFDFIQQKGNAFYAYVAKQAAEAKVPVA